LDNITATSTATYMGQARQTIEQLATNQYRWITTPPSVHNLDASRVLDVMLRNGGESSEAICVCPEIYKQVNLTRTWFTYLLWPFTAKTHQPSNLISDQATWTIDDTYGSLLNNGFGINFQLVNQWDSYRCIVSGVWDGPYMPASADQGIVTLIGAHILKCAVGVFTIDQAHTAAATWNIIWHYSGMSEETIQNMEMLVDNPCNGMMLQHDIHDNFDKLKIYLEQTEILDKYNGAAGGNIGSLKSNGDPVHQLSSMIVSQLHKVRCINFICSPVVLRQQTGKCK
ncbi:hypothetical protein BDR05DRAFT_953117, partial [Suillus weaverae]